MTDVFLYQGEANPADVKLADPTVLRSSGAITGTTDMTAPVGLLDATALETFAASGDVTAMAGALAATALETFASTAAMTAAAGALAAAGLETFAATGDVTAPAGALAGTVLETFASTGASAAPAGALAATGLETFASAGDVTAPSGALDATGTAGDGSVTGVADMVAPVGTLDATGLNDSVIIVAERVGSSGRSSGHVYDLVAYRARASVTLPVWQVSAQVDVAHAYAAQPALAVMGLGLSASVALRSGARETPAPVAYAAALSSLMPPLVSSAAVSRAYGTDAPLVAPALALTASVVFAPDTDADLIDLLTLFDDPLLAVLFAEADRDV